VAVTSRFTRIPKVSDLIMAGVPTEAIPTYCALADHADNNSGLCWPRMETLAGRLSRSPRTVQRHLHLLKERGLVEFVERRRDNRGRFGAYLYKVLHVAAAAAATARARARGGAKKGRATTTTGHGGRVGPNRGRTRRQEGTPLPPKKDPKGGYGWLFGHEAPPGEQEEHDRRVAQRREEEARRRARGFEWLFGQDRGPGGG
jgi:GntR family transcriptional regulator